MTESITGLQQLGHRTPLPTSPEAAILERVAAPHSKTPYVVRFTCPEFTSLCPVTGQPDFALIVLDYIPASWIVESKSLKLFFFSFRNHASFHEACTVEIARRLTELLDPVWLRLGTYWFPRGGMPIDVFWQTSEPPAGAWIPLQDVAPYRARF